MEVKKLCPMLTRTLVIHNSANDARVFRIGINAFKDNDVVFSEFLPCKEEKCMMYDVITKKCMYSEKKQ